MNMLTRAIMAAFAALAIAFTPLSSAAATSGDDHAQIMNLMGRYVFALDGRDADSYASVFAPDGLLIYGGGERRGRDALRQMVVELIARSDKERVESGSTLRPSRGRHFLSNVVIEVNGDTANVKDYWIAFHNNNPERSAALSGFGHGENKLVRINGQWLIQERKIYNEHDPKRAAADDNPSFRVPKSN